MLSTSFLTQELKKGEHVRMPTEFADFLFNVILLLFWFKIWGKSHRSTVFNPYLSRLDRAGDGLINFLRPLFFGLNARSIAIVSIVVLLLFRALAMGIAPPVTTQEGLALHWPIRFGFIQFDIQEKGILHHLVFSFTSFAIFLFNIWGLALIFLRPRLTAHRVRAQEFLHQASRPFSDAAFFAQPPILLGWGLAITLLLKICGEVLVQPGTELALQLNATTIVVNTLTALVDLLSIIRWFLLLGIIISWLSTLRNSHSLAGIGQEWMNLVLGPLARRPIRLGMMNLTPIIVFLALAALHLLLRVLLLTICIASQ